MAFTKNLEDKGIAINTINLGGGFAAFYVEGDKPIPVDIVSKNILETFSEENNKLNQKVKNLYIEPGRSIVAESGYMIYKIGYQKKTLN